LIVIEELHYRK